MIGRNRAKIPQEADRRHLDRRANFELRSAMEARGLDLEGLHREARLPLSRAKLASIIGLRRLPTAQEASRIAQVVGRKQEEIFTPSTVEVTREKQRAERLVSGTSTKTSVRARQWSALDAAMRRELLRRPTPSTEEADKRAEQLASLDELVAHLPADRQDVLRRYFGMHPYPSPQTSEEIARARGWTRSNVNAHKMRALKDLRWKLGIRPPETEKPPISKPPMVGKLSREFSRLITHHGEARIQREIQKLPDEHAIILSLRHGPEGNELHAWDTISAERAMDRKTLLRKYNKALKALAERLRK